VPQTIAAFFIWFWLLDCGHWLLKWLLFFSAKHPRTSVFPHTLPLQAGTAFSVLQACHRDNPALMQNGNSVDELFSILQILCSQKYRRAIISKLFDGLPTLDACSGVKPGGRLGEKNKLRYPSPEAGHDRRAAAGRSSHNGILTAGLYAFPGINRGLGPWRELADSIPGWIWSSSCYRTLAFAKVRSPLVRG
jgi:hypothetical protein